MTASAHKFAVLALALMTAGGCAAAAVGAGVGAAGAALVLTEKGAKAEVAGHANQLDDVARKVLRRDMAATMTEEKVEKGGDKYELKAQRGDTELVVKIERSSPGTAKVEVQAKKSPVGWDKSLAQDILRRIVRAS